MSKEKYASSWYGDRQFAVMEIPYAEDIDFFIELLHSKGIHYDYRSLSDNGNHVLLIFKDNIEKSF